MSKKTKKNKKDVFEKVIDFGKRFFAATVRSRTGSLSEMAQLLRFQPGTKGFHRLYEKLLPLIDELRQSFYAAVLKLFPDRGLRLGIIDDSSLPKSGKTFPKQQIHHEHSNNTFYSGMKVLSTSVYQAGKLPQSLQRLLEKEITNLMLQKKTLIYLLMSFSSISFFLTVGIARIKLSRKS